MTAVWIFLGVLVLGYILLNMKVTRPDGTLVSKLHPYRRMLSFVMPKRNESVVYFDDYIKADALLEYIERTRKAFHIDITHCLVNAAVGGLRENPKMNTFISGQRLYSRNHVAVTFSMKRKKKNKEAKVTAVKLQVKDEESFEEICKRMNEQIGVERSDKVTGVDKELNFFFRMPRPLMRFCMWFVKWADYNNILPAFFIRDDGFSTSMFIANLGSLNMRAGYHHLYEFGNCPLFLMVGKIEDKPVVEDGEVVVRKILHLRYSYDERIDDGLTSSYGMATVKRCLENPEEAFGVYGEDEEPEDEELEEEEVEEEEEEVEEEEEEAAEEEEEEEEEDDGDGEDEEEDEDGDEEENEDEDGEAETDKPKASK